jgi:hypothetical protein
LPIDYKLKIKNSLNDKSILSRDINFGGIDLNMSALVSYKAMNDLLKDDGILSFIFPHGVLNNKSYEGFRTLIQVKQILKPSKPFFDFEEPIILILQKNNVV